MATIDERITAAKAKIQAEEQSGDSLKIGIAKAELQTLEQMKQDGLGFSQEDINQAVTGRIPDAETSARAAERQTMAQHLGVEVDKLDEELQRIEHERLNSQSDTQRLSNDLATTNAQLQNAQAERDKQERLAQTARAELESTLKRNAVERELLSLGVTINETTNYLPGALQLTDLSEVKVEVEVAEDGKLSVKGDVQGAKEAAKKTKDAYGAMFGEVATGRPRETPEGHQGGSSSKGLGAYKPRYNTPAQRA